MAQSKKALRHEAAMCGNAVRPQLSEFFDSWMIIGVRAGGDEAVHIMHAPIRGTQGKLESVLASVVLDVVRKRKQCRRGPRKK